MPKKLTPTIPPVLNITTTEYRLASLRLDYLNPNSILAPILALDGSGDEIERFSSEYQELDIDNDFSSSDRNKFLKAVEDIEELILQRAINLSIIESGVISDQ